MSKRVSTRVLAACISLNWTSPRAPEDRAPMVKAKAATMSALRNTIFMMCTPLCWLMNGPFHLAATNIMHRDDLFGSDK